jgi:hypothetical protein
MPQAIRTPKGHLRITATSAHDFARVLHILRTTEFDTLPLARKFTRTTREGVQVPRVRGSVILTADQATLLAFLVRDYGALEHGGESSIGYAERFNVDAASDILRTLRTGGPHTLGIYAGEQQWTPAARG